MSTSDKSVEHANKQKAKQWENHHIQGWQLDCFAWLLDPSVLNDKAATVCQPPSQLSLSFPVTSLDDPPA